MPYITLRYGPYKCHGIIDHRVKKINGLFNALNQSGYEIEVIPINEYNRLSIEMFDREIFRCDIRNLMFNMPMEDDPVCQRAVRVVDEAKERMTISENAPMYSSILKGSRDLKPVPDKSNIEDALPSKTELYEIHPENLHRSMSKHLPITEIAPTKTEEKVGKVKIMEDKNTMFVSQPLKLVFDDENKLHDFY